MPTYTVKHGQSLSDVLLSIYGSIEGMVDLMISNPSLSIANDLKQGDILVYSDDFVNKSRVSYFNDNDIIISNGVGKVYHKSTDDEIKFKIYMPPDQLSTEIIVSGNGKMVIDWGDNSPLEVTCLKNPAIRIAHVMNNNINEEREITIYGDFTLRQLDLSHLSPTRVFTISPTVVNEFKLVDSEPDNHEFTVLLEHLSELNLSRSKIKDLSPLIELEEVMSVDLSGCRMSQRVIDEYLIGIVKDYRLRRNCSLNLQNTAKPSGLYVAPVILSSPTTGMEAIWVLTNDREAEDKWNFNLGDVQY